MTKSAFIAQELRACIANGEWQPGEKIMSEAELCARYGVSRPPVRSALNTLVTQGLLVSYRGKGTFVREKSNDIAGGALLFNQNDISRMELFEFRRMIETEAASMAALRADDAIIEELKQATIALQEAANTKEAVAADMSFHFLLAKASHNTVIVSTFEMLRDSYQKMLEQNVARRGLDGAREHLQIVLAIASRNPELAKKCMTVHLNNSMSQAEENSFLRDASNRLDVQM